ncbi:MAG: four helix bundle protein [Planctomycetota bacterium]
MIFNSKNRIENTHIKDQAASSKRDFTKYLNIALKSANESKLWVALLRDSKRTTREETQWFLDELEEIANIFGSSLLTLRGKK